MKFKSLLVTVAIALGSLLGNAADESAMVITAKDGATTRIVLARWMKGGIIDGTYNGGEAGTLYFTVRDSNSDDAVELLSMPVSQLDKIDFENVWAGVNATGADNTLTVNVAEGKLFIAGITAPLLLTVYGVDGTVEENTEIKNDCEWSLAQYGVGLHIVKIGTLTFKIMIK